MDNRMRGYRPDRIQLELDQMYRSMGASRHVSRVWETLHANGLTARPNDGNVGSSSRSVDREDVILHHGNGEPVAQLVNVENLRDELFSKL
uniref:Uncharacterized protein n=1 Tax=Acrobeloides nanus TaxID=290746 RepID=A0A914CMA9_9BILA